MLHLLSSWIAERVAIIADYHEDLEPDPNGRVADLISYFANQIWNEKYQQRIRTYDWSSDSHYSFLSLLPFMIWNWVLHKMEIKINSI